MTPRLQAAKLLVVKIGSALLVDQAAPRAEWLDGVAADIAAARARGSSVIVVSSGAIALARSALGPRRAAGCGSRRSRRPPPSARSGSRRPGRRRFRITAWLPRNSC